MIESVHTNKNWHAINWIVLAEQIKSGAITNQFCVYRSLIREAGQERQLTVS